MGNSFGAIPLVIFLPWLDWAEHREQRSQSNQWSSLGEHIEINSLLEGKLDPMPSWGGGGIPFGKTLPEEQQTHALDP